MHRRVPSIDLLVRGVRTCVLDPRNGAGTVEFSPSARPHVFHRRLDMSIVGGDGPAAAGHAVNNVRTASGYHHLVVKFYSRIKETTPVGRRIISLPFTVAGHRWCIHCYPNGDRFESADFISLFLCLLDEDVAKPLEVEYMFSFIDQVETPKLARDSFSSRHHSWGCLRFKKKEALERSKHLKDDSFTIRCDVTVTNPPTAAATFVVEVPRSNIRQHLRELLLAEDGADVTFEVGGETYAAHRCVLAARSEVFKAELFGAMKDEGTTTAATGVVVRIDDMEARVFRAMLGFIYDDSLPEMKVEGDQDQDVMWQRLLVAADTYDLPRLRLMCEEKLCEYINVSTVATILALAERHHCRGLKETCLEFLSSDDVNLQRVMATGGLDSLVACYPFVLKDLITKLVSTKSHK